MPVQIYNSLTKKKEDFVPLNGKTVKMYSCGVTVYDQCHLGHARSLYIFDVIKRYLSYRGYDVHFVRNITDIDDKIINKAIEFNISSDEVVRENIDSYNDDLQKLGIAQAVGKDKEEPRATKNIEDIKKDIAKLIEKGFAYEVDGDVYYSVRKFKDYGKLSGQSVEKMLEAVRIELDSKKKDHLDFALWKKSKEGEPYWESPWGQGRPGWHIECSCMSLKHLDCETLDIHAGGRDLIFPHHENEIAQAEVLSGKPFAKYWIHHGLLTINGQKMAKSLGNFITVKDALKKFSVDELKLFFLSSHYASGIDFSEIKMNEVKRVYERIDILMRKLDKLYGTREISRVVSGGTGGMELFRQKFIEYMDDDFNTPRVLSVLFDMVNKCNKLLDSEDELKTFILRYALDTIKEMADVFGLKSFGSLKDKLTEEEERLLKDRIEARKNKDFRRSDEIRSLLKQKGIVLEDTKNGQAWRRV